MVGGTPQGVGLVGRKIFHLAREKGDRAVQRQGGAEDKGIAHGDGEAGG